MAWDFATEPEFHEQLDWVGDFVREEVEPLDLLFHDRPACHLAPELGGQRFGQVRLALINEILGRSVFAPRVFGCQAMATNTSSRGRSGSHSGFPITG